MTDLMPLLFMWLYSRSQSPALAAHASAPAWPTPASPPPMPAFDAQPSAHTPSAHSADPSHTSTPLADLHNAPPTLAPASSTQPEALKAKQSVPSQIKQAAVQAFKRKAASALHRSVPTSTATQRANDAVRKFANAHALKVTQAPPSTASTVEVSSLQQILNRNGFKVKRDGLFGPKTANAWQSLAARKHLDNKIARVDPNHAKVVTRTYDALSIP